MSLNTPMSTVAAVDASAMNFRLKLSRMLSRADSTRVISSRQCLGHQNSPCALTSVCTLVINLRTNAAIGSRCYHSVRDTTKIQHTKKPRPIRPIILFFEYPAGEGGKGDG